ncbi:MULTISPECIES: tol-pal system protein YbgF [Desulfococcus]|uniref:Tol-pal system protein YbgF n=1 Tax=Desulfococcus multivorans DSM 2059 TaxID=1121405 RepID=S7V0I8_DESML|nr:tol-pal system protein YbgF [Desulfococcus multivorans]AOY59485.1 YbgF: Tol-Pal system, periplasmic component [Desulfococcus multivorans]AQV01685.2 tol-pal system protein YbgF [Desulfococcus multivorans]EPR40004.1 tol-pal system protein YbgF [Desulfococcus multivorans DSM 2059]SKA01537.1 tol-pal system protein YbgF [Desulfococcus multivorans DSM 2059]
MKPIRMTCLATTLICGMMGCASQSDIRILEDRVIALERRNLELQQQTTEDIDAKAAALRNQSASLQVATDQVRNEIQALDGKLEETRYQLTEQTRTSEDVSRRLTRIEDILQIPVSDMASGSTVSGSNAPSPSAPTTPATQGAAAIAATENELYQTAKQAFDRGDFDQARQGFQELLLQYPNARNGDSAQFWIGETFYRQKEYEQAILEYQTVIEKYPSGKKVQAAFLKQGFAFAGMGDKANARLILQELIEKYPGSSEAKIARQKLSTL